MKIKCHADCEGRTLIWGKDGSAVHFNVDIVQVITQHTRE